MPDRIAQLEAERDAAIARAERAEAVLEELVEEMAVNRQSQRASNGYERNYIAAYDLRCESAMPLTSAYLQEREAARA